MFSLWNIKLIVMLLLFVKSQWLSLNNVAFEHDAAINYQIKSNQTDMNGQAYFTVIFSKIIMMMDMAMFKLISANRNLDHHRSSGMANETVWRSAILRQISNVRSDVLLRQSILNFFLTFQTENWNLAKT